ncbi:hypothetical protein SO694_00064173 [Aureococcus anophagefferens]|uniref:CCHC-type domain-containing protein n=1 Tax=Aureococcus anophagefferens TaxID=44056 RepID=A0ABR1FQN9_AURAN
MEPEVQLPLAKDGTVCVCFECGEPGHFGRDCPVRLANGGRRGRAPKRKRVRFDEEDDDEDPLASGGWSRPRPPRDDDDDDDDDGGGARPFDDGDDDGDDNVGDRAGGDEDDDDEDEAPVRRMTEEAVGEEDDTGERFNEVGERIEPFNLRSERENDGFFDANGNFVWKKGDEEPDEWLAQMDEATMEAAIGAAARRAADDDGDDDGGEDPALMGDDRKRAVAAELAALLEPGEKVAGGVRRLGRALKAKGAGAAEAFETLSGLADALVSAGRAAVYDETREDLERFAAPPRALAPAGDDRAWEYRATDGGVYGPYDTQTILDWRSGGFFTGDSAVPMREVARAPAPKPAAAADDLAADLEDSDDDDTPPPENPNRWVHSDDIDFLGDGVESPLP